MLERVITAAALMLPGIAMATISVPEPTTMALVGLGVVAAASVSARRRKK